MIKIENICYSYNNIEALKNVTLHIDKGESVAFIGPNGSGKSTLIKVINGLVFPQKGNYYFNGEKITSKKLENNQFSKSFHKKIGLIFQNSEVQLFCSNVFDEIAFGLRQMGMDEREVEKRVEDILNTLKIQDLRNRQPYHLSGGEKKKVAIASALVLNPDILVLDEPMNGLDPRSKRFMKELMITLNNAGKIILCSTHDFNYVEGVFKRAVVFSDNHTIIRDGNYNEIMQDNNFLYENNII